MSTGGRSIGNESGRANEIVRARSLICCCASAILFAALLFVTSAAADQKAPAPEQKNTTSTRKRTTTAKAPPKAPQPAPAPPEQIQPQPPDWPANDRPAEAKVAWNSKGLRIDAANSSLQQILKDVATATGAKISGLGADQRVFGTFGPGPAASSTCS